MEDLDLGKIYNISDCRSSYMLIFDVLLMCLKLASSPHIVYHFSRKGFLLLYSNNLPSFIVWLPLHYEKLGNACIVVICYPVCDVINFYITLNHFVKPFFYLTKKSERKCKYLKIWMYKSQRCEILTWNKKGFHQFQIFSCQKLRERTFKQKKLDVFKSRVVIASLLDLKYLYIFDIF